MSEVTGRPQQKTIRDMSHISSVMSPTENNGTSSNYTTAVQKA